MLLFLHRVNFQYSHILEGLLHNELHHGVAQISFCESRYFVSGVRSVSAIARSGYDTDVSPDAWAGQHRRLLAQTYKFGSWNHVA